MDARSCGRTVNNKICVTGTQGRQWPGCDAPFTYISSKDGMTRYGVQKMKYGLQTSENLHYVGCYYPIKDTTQAAKIVSIGEDGEDVIVTIIYNGHETVAIPQQFTCPLSWLLLVNEYTIPDGKPKTTQSSSVPKIACTPLRRAPIRGNPITAIAVASVDNPGDIYTKLIQLSPDYEEPITLAITHQKMHPDALELREFSDMNAISELFYTQGIMDEANQGLSCGVEAVNNAGFTVTAVNFSEEVATGLDVRKFMVDERPRNHDDYINNTGGGNNIPYNQMFLTMKNLAQKQGLEMDPSPHLTRKDIGTHEFWVGHQWVILQIPVGGGHWVSMEKIMYKGQPAICLREGRGKVMYDFITSPADGSCVRLPAGVTGTKRKERKER